MLHKFYTNSSCSNTNLLKSFYRKEVTCGWGHRLKKKIYANHY